MYLDASTATVSDASFTSCSAVSDCGSHSYRHQGKPHQTRRRYTITPSNDDHKQLAQTDIRTVGDGPASCIRDMWTHSTDTAVDTPSLPPACLPLSADPLHSLSLSMAHSCTRSFDPPPSYGLRGARLHELAAGLLRGVRRPSDLTHIAHIRSNRI